MRWAAWVSVLALTSSCAVVMNANAHHNSRGRACPTEPVFGIIDLLAAGGSTAVVLGSEVSRGWLAVPITLAASGLVGIVTAARCRRDEPAEVAHDVAPATTTSPSLGDAPVDPEAQPATAEDMGLAPVTPKPLLDRNGIPANLPLPPAPPVGGPSVQPETTLTCKLAPPLPCPDGYYCRLVAENTGECIKI